jgi:hypothetical protein
MDLPDSPEALRAIIEKATAEAAERGVSEPYRRIERIIINEGDPLPRPVNDSSPSPQPHQIVRVIIRRPKAKDVPSGGDGGRA